MEDIILNKLKSATNATEAEEIINEVFPGWLICHLYGYCDDYPHFTTNWEKICDKIGTTPKFIVLVNDIEFTESPTLKNKICEFLTMYGYCVRRREEFLPCGSCEKAIPCREIWNLLKQHNTNTPNSGIVLPEVWSNKCVNC
jgi:hypothetical protein